MGPPTRPTIDRNAHLLQGVQQPYNRIVTVLSDDAKYVRSKKSHAVPGIAETGVAIRAGGRNVSVYGAALQSRGIYSGGPGILYI